MATKRIGSTEAQNNFGQVLSDAAQNRTRYVVERHGVPQAIIVSFDDFSDLLNSSVEREQMRTLLREVRPEYGLGKVLGNETSRE